MQTGALRHRIVIEQLGTTRTGTGGETKSWSTFATVWGKKMDGKSREFFAAQAVQSEVRTLFEIRYITGITNLMRVSFEGVLYDIHAVTDPEDRKRKLHLQCVRGINRG